MSSPVDPEPSFPDAPPIPDPGSEVELDRAIVTDLFTIRYPGTATATPGRTIDDEHVVLSIDDLEYPLLAQVAINDVEPTEDQTPADTLAAMVLTRFAELPGFEVLINQPSAYSPERTARIVELVISEPRAARTVLVTVTLSERTALQLNIGMPVGAMDARHAAYAIATSLEFRDPPSS